MNVLLLASHGIAEYDDVRMFHHLGYDVFCPGGYSNPAKPGETLRPALPKVPYHSDLALLCDIQRARHKNEPGRYIDWAKADLHPDLIDWADVIIVHHFVREWIRDQWPRIRHKRVIWRTCGQSDPGLELDMAPLRHDGLQIVRYSPAERRYFGKIGAFAGEDALIRFGKFVDDYGPWNGEQAVVGNLTQNMIERGEAVGLSFYLDATKGLAAKPAGPGSEQLPGGVGALEYDRMRQYLRLCRAYMYTGTVPASYTLGLIEAMLSGVPVVAMHRKQWGSLADIYEAGEITGWGAYTPEEAHEWLARLLAEPDYLRSQAVRQRAVELFGMETVGPQWQAFLGTPTNTRATPVGAWDLVL